MSKKDDVSAAIVALIIGYVVGFISCHQISLEEENGDTVLQTTEFRK